MKAMYTLPLVLVLLAAGCGEPPQAPEGLLVDLLRWPEAAVVTDPEPEFSWIVRDERRGAVQTAYRVLVASRPERARDGAADVWDSGRVASDRSVAVSYAGTPLQPNTDYWWTVRTWDRDGAASPFAEAQRFRTGTFDRSGAPWPGASAWVAGADGDLVLENRQRPEIHRLPPAEVATLGPGHVVADFGRAAFATLELTLTAPDPAPADSVIVYLGERRYPDGTVHKEPGVSNIGFDRIALAPRPGTHVYLLELPRHRARYPNSQILPDHLPEVTPFRYVEILNSPSDVGAGDLRQAALFYPFDDDASSFSSSDDRLNRVWDLCKYTLKATPFLALYADGNRERMPYEADAYIQQLGHYAVDREFAVARHTHQFLIYNPAWPTEWHLHTVLMAWADYLHTGDAESIRAHYDALRAKTLLALARDDGLISTTTGLVTDDFLRSIHYDGTSFRDIVDWPRGTPPGERQPSNAGPTPEGERDGYVFRDVNTVVNAFHYRSLVLMGRMAEAVGRDDDARFFADRAALVYDSFNRLLFDAGRGIYVDGIGTEHAALHANMFPLAFGLVPDARMPGVAAFVKSRGMACSVYGAQYLLEALYAAGEDAHALGLMTSDSTRSWLNMLRVGSTMTTEAWDAYYKPNLTWNHAWGSAPANIIPRKLMGVEPVEPGFRTVRIRPQPGGLASVRLKTPTVRGPVETTWEQEEGRYRFDVSLPANVHAEVWLPGASADEVSEGGRTLGAAEGVEVVEQREGRVVVRVTGGTYRFEGPATEE